MTIQQARIAVGQQIGLASDYDGSMTATSNLPVESKQKLTAALIAYIVNNPGDFTDAQVATANAEANRATSLASTSGYTTPVAAFFDELENQALRVGGAVASVGEGVVSSVNLVGTLLPVAVLGAIIIFALPYINKARTS